MSASRQSATPSAVRCRGHSFQFYSTRKAAGCLHFFILCGRIAAQWLISMKNEKIIPIFHKERWQLSVQLKFDRYTILLWVLTGIIALLSATGVLAGVSTKVVAALTVLLLCASPMRICAQKGNIISELLGWALIICGSILTSFLSQKMLSAPWTALGWKLCALNAACCVVVTLFFLLVTARPKLSLALSQAFLIIFTLVNEAVLQGRGRDMVFSDVFSAGTAINVLGSYHFKMTAGVVYGFILLAAEMMVISNLKLSRVSRARQRIVSAVLLLAVSAGLLMGSKGMVAQHWATTGRNTYGFFLNYVRSIPEMIQKKPDGYSLERIAEISEEYPSSNAEGSRQPNIIVIMNESFADLRVFGDLKTNIDVLPVFDSLQENVIKGYALASVYGGGTANSEYDFLTGNSMAFLPDGVSVYQVYLKTPTCSVVSHLKNQGYSCTAMHPFHADGWDRTRVYPLLGFEQMLFLEDFPQKDTLRGFVSDREMYEKLIAVYEEKSDGPQFIYGVTMQNHGGYDYAGDNYEKTVELRGYAGSYPLTEQYLSVLHESDQAIAYLLDYFKSVDEDVVIVFYGDHQPMIEGRFYEEMLGKRGAEFELADKQLQYTVPFFVWANYDIEEKFVDGTSLNFLSNYLFQAAGMEPPAFNQFLRDVEGEIPAMNALGYYSKNAGGYLPYSSAEGTEAAILDKYWLLEYHTLFDSKNLNPQLFPLFERGE